MDRRAQLKELARQMMAQCLEDGADPELISIRFAGKLAVMGLEWKIEDQEIRAENGEL